MLSDETIKKELESGNIEISVAFSMEENGDLNTYSNEECILNTSLSKNVYSDRVKLTLGPLVKRLDNAPVPKKNRFKNSRDCFDLRTNENKYLLEPGESIILITNERIKLNGKYGCLVIPRISLSDVGILVSTAYVDPYYQGVMRLHMVNLSKNPYELKTVEAIAQCFFFELTSDVSVKYQEEFSAKSVFYGQTWNGILQTDRVPFPTKKNSVETYSIGKILSIIKRFIELVHKYYGVALFITGVIAIYSTFNYLKVRVEDTADKVDYMTAWLTPTASEILIKARGKSGEKKVIIECSKADIVSVLCNNDDIGYRISSGNTDDESVVVFTYELTSAANDDYEVNFT